MGVTLYRRGVLGSVSGQKAVPVTLQPPTIDPLAGVIGSDLIGGRK